MSVITPSELNYQKVKSQRPKYRYRRILPDHGGANINVGNSQRQTINFKIDPEVHNMARSYLNFEFKVPANAKANYIHKNCLSFIEQIQYYSQNGSTYLVYINYLNNYTNIVWPA